MAFRKFHNLQPGNWIWFKTGKVRHSGRVISVRTRISDGMPLVTVSYWNGKYQTRTEIDQSRYAGIQQGQNGVSIYKKEA